MRKSLTNSRRRHGLQPQTLNGFVVFCRLHDVAEDQFTFTPRVACVDDKVNILAMNKLFEVLELLTRLGNRLQVKIRRQNRQMRKRPFATFDFVGLRTRQLQKMTEGVSYNVVLALVIVSGFLQSADNFRDVDSN